MYNTDVYGDRGCTDNCNRVYYYFYLVNNAQENNLTNDEPFAFTNLSITGTLAFTQGTGSPTGKALSEANITESACSPDVPGLNNAGITNCPILSYDPQSNIFTYEISSNDAGSPIIYYAVCGRMPLFVLAVDVYPGETVEPSGMTYSFTVIDGSAPTPCNNQTVTNCTSHENLNKTIAAPGSDCTGPAGIPTFRIGEAEDDPIAGFPNREKVPVWVDAQNNSFSWAEADFLLSVVPGTGENMLLSKVEPGLFALSDLQVYSVGAQFRVYAHRKGTIAIQNARL